MFSPLDEYPNVRPAQTRQEFFENFGQPRWKPDPDVPSKIILDRAYANKWLVLEWVPILGQVYIHRCMIRPLHAALSMIGQSPYFDYIDPSQCGIFNPRRMSWDPHSPISFHAFALAVDINWSENGRGRRGTIQDRPYVIKSFKDQGFYWGGDWQYPDSMHFQFVHPRLRFR